MKAFAVDLGGSHATCALIEDSVLIGSETIHAPEGTLLGDLLPEFVRRFDAIASGAKVPRAEIAGIAMSFCGIVDPVASAVVSTNGKFQDAPKLDLPLWAAEELNLPLRMENDARMALLGEQYAGAGRGLNNAVMMTLGTGIGVAAMLEGSLLMGKHFQAGCAGAHIPLMLSRRPCTCGGYGCAEAEASGWALPLICREWPGFAESALAQQAINFQNLFQCATDRDPIARAILQRCLEVWAGVAIALIHAYDPDAVILGGGVLQSGDLIPEFIQKQVTQRSWIPWGRVEILRAVLGRDAPLLGAVPLLSRSKRGQINVR